MQLYVQSHRKYTRLGQHRILDSNSAYLEHGFICFVVNVISPTTLDVLTKSGLSNSEPVVDSSVQIALALPLKSVPINITGDLHFVTLVVQLVTSSGAFAIQKEGHDAQRRRRSSENNIVESGLSDFFLFF